MPTDDNFDPDAALATSRALVKALNNPSAFDHPVRDLDIIETHISWVLLTGDYAYKIKKPVNFGFLDFSTLELRQHFCNEELRLNRRFAPEIYLDVVRISGDRARPRVSASGPVLDYALRMRQFAQSSLLSAYAERNALEPHHIDAIADRVAAVHRDCDRAAAGDAFGSVDSIEHWSEENLAHLRDTVPAAILPPAFERLQRWFHRDAALEQCITARQRDGFVRECHGDLHLGNMAYIDERVVLFDCIEFNPELRWIDTISEAAFVAMDLQARGFPAYAWRFLDRYLAASGDYAGTALLRYYFVYRALVRAKVEALRIAPPAPGASVSAATFAGSLRYIELADRWARGHRAALVLMHGLSGSGKSTVAAALVEALGAVRVRSDVERKRLYDLEADAASGSATGAGIYTAEASSRTYGRLAEIATTVLDSDFCIIVDAAFLRRDQRRMLLEVESRCRFETIVVECHAPADELRRRIESRRDDPSEANLAVLQHQLETVEPLSADEPASIVRVGPDGLDTATLDEIRRRLGLADSNPES